MACTAVHAQIPAFPGAEGFGAYATGGRGGDVYTVVNLNSSGPGSLRYGIENAPASGRTIVFAVSGYIPISYNSDTGNQTVRIVKNNVRIAGETAPGDGIGLKDGRILVTGDNTIMRHIRVRHGKYGGAGDCINIESSAANTMIDHVTLMFSTDENISFFNNAADDFTFQNSISAWGMERHNAGGLWDLEDGTCHHSLWAHHRTRNPKARPYGLLEWINNVTYHWRSEGFIMGDSESNVDWYANVIGCYYLDIADYAFGLDSTPLSKARIASDGQPNFHLYLNDTLIDANGNGVLDGVDNGYGIVSGSPDISATPFPGAPVPVTTDDPLTAYKKVLSASGALRLDASYAGPLRDELDELLIESVENQESILVAKDTPVTTDPEEPPSNGEQHLADDYGISNGGFGTLNTAPAPTDTDGDGMPDIWENATGSSALTPNHNNPVPAGGYIPSSPAGYTRLEEYLHFKSVPHAIMAKSTVSGPSSLSVDLRKYTRGFNVVPVVFTISNEQNGSASVQPDGYTVVFEPTQDFSGRARFDFTVTDGDGSTWTQTMAVLVSGDLVLPGAPTGLSATAVSSYQIDLSWADHADNETGFRIERSINDDTSFTEIDTVPADTTSYSDDSLLNDTTYYYRVRAYNGVGNSAYTAVASDITPDGPPAPPSILSVIPANNQITLSWSTSPGADSYIVKRSSSYGGPYAGISTNATTTYMDTGLVNGTTYFYVVSAVSAFGESENSVPVSAVPELVVSYKINSGGGAASPFVADDYFAGGSTYSNTGTIDTSGVTDPAPAAVYQTERNNDFTYTFPGLVPGEDYRVRLHFAEIYHSSSGQRLFNVTINGTEVLSNFDVFAVTGARYKAMVREFIVPANGSGQMVIEFETILDNAKCSGIEVLNAPAAPKILSHPVKQSVEAGGTAAFTVLASGDPSPSFVWMKNGVELAGQTNATLTLSDAQTADQGIYSVAVYNSQGAVISSNAALTVGTASGVPTGLFATAGNNRVDLNWYGVAGATGYNVKRGTASGGAYQKIATVADAAYTDLTALNGTTYYYVVSANAPAETGNSAEVSALPAAAKGGMTIQAEDVTSTYGGGVTMDSNNAGFHVSAFANFPTTGGYLQFNNVDGGTGGAAQLIVRFALGNTARTGSLIVNGTATSIQFPGTGSFTTWDTLTVPVTLGAGPINTIRLESTGQDLANVDEITVVPTVVNIPSMYPAADPVAYYRFEEGSAGTDVPVGGNALLDTAGADDNMNVDSGAEAPTYAAAVPEIAIPQNGESNSLSGFFDGSDAAYSAIAAGPLNTTDFSDITIETYVRFSGLVDYQTIIGRDDTEGSANGQDGNPEALFYLYKHPDNTLHAEVSTVGGDRVVVAGSTVVTTGTWYHVAVVGDAAAGTFTLYVDGDIEGSTAGFDGLFNPAEDNPWTLGRGQYGGYNGGDYLSGSIDEVRITPDALPPLLFLDTFNPDFDADGLLDAWERQYFGNLDQGPDDDPDLDGIINSVEQANGTDPSVPNLPPQIDPVAYYRFEEGAAGTEVPAGVHAILDTAGGNDNMNADSSAEAPAYAAEVPENPVPQYGLTNTLSAFFDGSDAAYSALPACPLNTTDFADFTVETYVRFASLTDYQTIIGRDDTEGSTNGQDGHPEALFYLYKHPDNTLHVEATTAGGDRVVVAGTSVVSTDTWYHVAAVGSVSNGTLTLYINGESEGYATGFDGLFNPAENNPWTLGRGQYAGYNGGDNLSGYIDEVRFTPGALPPLYFLNAESSGSDSDEDGLDDAWELQYFGNLGQGPYDDPDGDGADNVTEQANGTDPTISNLPPVIEIQAANGVVYLSWPSNHTGWNLEYRTNLMDSGLSTNWIPVPEASVTNGFDIPVSGEEGDRAYFRLVLP